jgi:hypothetical protein
MTPEEAFFTFLGMRVPWTQSGGAGWGRAVVAMRRIAMGTRIVERIKKVGTALVRNRVALIPAAVLRAMRQSLVRIFSHFLGRRVSISDHFINRFVTRFLRPEGELSHLSFGDIIHVLKTGRYWRNLETGSLVAANRRVAIAMTVRGGRIYLRTIEPSSQFRNITGREIFRKTQQGELRKIYERATSPL